MPRQLSPLIYVDSNVYIDLIQRNETLHSDSGEPRWRSAKVLFDAINADLARLASSALVEAEVCCNGDARQGAEEVRGLLRGWFTAPETVWSDVDRFLAREAVSLMNEHRDKAESADKRMGAADTMHLAAAVRLGADFFMTHDAGFPMTHKISGVHVMRPDVVWPETLWAEEEAG